MDLTIPYTFYPLALPHWIAWALFSAAIVGAACVGVVARRRGSWARGVGYGLVGGAVLLFLTMVASMVITFFVHDL